MHKNNFDFLRLLFALAVIITHSFTLTGEAATDWLYTVTNGQVYISYLGVRGFFVISGYLIFISLLRTENLFDYFRNRILRIFPALAIVLLLTVIFAYFVYNGDFQSYLKNKSVWTYFPNNIKLYNLQGTIDGTLLRNPYHDDINGSIWTLQYEFACYILISFLFFFKNIKAKTILITIVAALFIAGNIALGPFTVLHHTSFKENVIDFGTFFFAGAFLACIGIEKMGSRKIIFIICALALVISFFFNIFYIVHLFAFPAAVIIFGTSSSKYISTFANYTGDVSYGVYIYAYPVQQALVYFFGPGYIALIIYASIVSILLGALSWRFIEKPALRFKKHGLKPVS